MATKFNCEAVAESLVSVRSPKTYADRGVSTHTKLCRRHRLVVWLKILRTQMPLLPYRKVTFYKISPTSPGKALPPPSLLFLISQTLIWLRGKRSTA